MLMDGNTYRVRSLGHHLGLEAVEAVGLGVERVLGLGDLVEEVGGLIHPVLAHEHVGLLHPLGPALAVGGEVHDAAGPDDHVQRHHLRDGGAQQLVGEELAARLVEGLVGAQVQVPPRKLLTAVREEEEGETCN